MTRFDGKSQLIASKPPDLRKARWQGIKASDGLRPRLCPRPAPLWACNCLGDLGIVVTWPTDRSSAPTRLIWNGARISIHRSFLAAPCTPNAILHPSPAAVRIFEKKRAPGQAAAQILHRGVGDPFLPKRRARIFPVACHMTAQAKGLVDTPRYHKPSLHGQNHGAHRLPSQEHIVAATRPDAPANCAVFQRGKAIAQQMIWRDQHQVLLDSVWATRPPHAKKAA